ncbi:MAG: deoxyribose-phosphate aldolase [Thermoflexales bacterium]|nr:deoxyribose-phosphate aldolase [Thermoflexales bacterium]
MNLNRYIDHTLLKPDATRAQIEQLCAEGRQHQFASVCVNACWVKLCAELLAGSGVNVCVTVGFPLGATTTRVKMLEAEQSLMAGAREADMVLNIGALKSGLHAFVRDDIAGVAQVCHAQGGLLKVIIETGLLTDEEKRLACQLAKDAGADFVKTCSGFNGGAATVEDVRLMRAVVGHEMGVKAAGGVRTYEAARAMIEAGANRIGTSSGVAIVLGAPAAAAQSY